MPTDPQTGHDPGTDPEWGFADATSAWIYGITVISSLTFFGWILYQIFFVW